MLTIRRRVSSYSCPKHPETKLEIVGLDAYFCPTCDHDWVIHPLRGRERRVYRRDNL